MSPHEPRDGADDLTRRKWILTLGQVAALAGVSGMVPELATTLAHSEEQQSTALPPGLYYPSQEHLSSALAGDLHAIPPGSETEYIRPNSQPFRPQFFSDGELKVITRIIRNLLGRVDAGALDQAVEWFDLYLHSAAAVRDAALNLDPLHRALAVAYSGESAVRELETAAPDRAVRSGLAALERLSREQYGHEFLSLDESQATELVAKISAEESGSPLRILYELTRSESIRGYYTSAEGLKELDYKGNWYYAQCPGCARP